MVWGMGLPRDFGEFWPDGDFEGWSGGLVQHYMKQPPAIQRNLYAGHSDPVECAVYYPLYVSRKFTNEVGSRMTPRPEDPPFTRILDHEAPKIFVTEKSYKELGSLIMFNDRIIAVDDALKEIIERFELGRHHFFPIKIIMPEGQIFPKIFYTLFIGQYFDSFVPEKSDGQAFREIPNSDGKLSIIAGPKNKIPGLALSRHIHGDAHLWRERRFTEWLTCFSGELVNEIEKAGLRIPKLHEMMEV